MQPEILAPQRGLANVSVAAMPFCIDGGFEEGWRRIVVYMEFSANVMVKKVAKMMSAGSFSL